MIQRRNSIYVCAIIISNCHSFQVLDQASSPLDSKSLALLRNTDTLLDSNILVVYYRRRDHKFVHFYKRWEFHILAWILKEHQLYHWSWRSRHTQQFEGQASLDRTYVPQCTPTPKSTTNPTTSHINQHSSLPLPQIYLPSRRTYRALSPNNGVRYWIPPSPAQSHNRSHTSY